MKLISKKEPAFTPIKLELIVESQVELDNLHNLFNYSPVCDALGIDTDPIRAALKEAGADPSTECWTEFVSIVDKKKK